MSSIVSPGLLRNAMMATLTKLLSACGGRWKIGSGILSDWISAPMQRCDATCGHTRRGL